MKSLSELRADIDALDQQILELLNARAALSLAVAAAKKQRDGEVVRVAYPERERAIIERLIAHHTGELSAAQIECIFQAILSCSRTLQEQYLQAQGCMIQRES